MNIKLTCNKSFQLAYKRKQQNKLNVILLHKGVWNNKTAIYNRYQKCFVCHEILKYAQQENSTHTHTHIKRILLVPTFLHEKANSQHKPQSNM